MFIPNILFLTSDLLTKLFSMNARSTSPRKFLWILHTALLFSLSCFKVFLSHVFSVISGSCFVAWETGVWIAYCYTGAWLKIEFSNFKRLQICVNFWFHTSEYWGVYSFQNIGGCWVKILGGVYTPNTPMICTPERSSNCAKF